MSNIYLNNGEWEVWEDILDQLNMKTIKKVSIKTKGDDRTGSMTGAPSPKERAAMNIKPGIKGTTTAATPKMNRTIKAMPKMKMMPMKVNKVANSTPMIKVKKVTKKK